MAWKNGQSIESAEDMAAYIATGDRNEDGPNGEHVPDIAECGTCGGTWDDALVTGVTPTPSGRCPFEYWHDAADEDDAAASAEVFTVTTAFNGDSPDGSAAADVRVYADLPTARMAYDKARNKYAGRDYVGLWSTELPNGGSPEELPEHGWILAYASPPEESSEYGEEDEVGITLAAHPILRGAS